MSDLAYLKRLAYKDRYNLAEDQSLDTESLEVLSNDPTSSVRVLVASNKNTSPETLTVMATDKSSLVVEAVLKNANTPKKVHAKLANGQGLTVPKEEFALLDSLNASIDNLYKYYHHGFDSLRRNKSASSAPIIDYAKIKKKMALVVGAKNIVRDLTRTK